MKQDVDWRNNEYPLPDDFGKKSWLQRSSDYSAKFSEWDDIKFTAGPVILVAVILASVAFLAVTLFGLLG